LLQDKFQNISQKFIERRQDLIVYNYLGSLTLKIFKIIIGDRGNGTTASAPAPARAHCVEVAILQIAALIIGAIISFAMTILSMEI